MEWTADVAVGDWIRERIDDPWRGTMHDVVPRGFEAYARVFHPVERERPVGRDWPPLPYSSHRREWEAFQLANPRFEAERVTWRQAAEAFGTTMHVLAQWHHLADKFQEVPGEDGPRDAAGWRYGRPATGQLAPDLVAMVASTLARHTTTPADGFVAVWEGWGGLVGALGYGPSRALLTLSATDTPRDAIEARHVDFLEHSGRDQLNNAFRKPTWQEGILSDEVSRGPRLRLPGRDHVLFRGGVSELADPTWVEHVPWRDRESESAGFGASAESPSLVWPDDRAWVLVSEVDYDSTLVGGSHALVRALCTDPGLEALPIREGADLGWDADDVNR
ncbi:hypothetical protein G5T42_05405 [Microbacterium sp. 4R-513]|uniref:hypothetical protein n=1 Tax=Microbacterium sp. 4R-513 TaxID=2567934 RepID=UPI0013E14C5C|nr:hypothetical protein [Microbacterium sp. 4R-513]QIG38995.1 hypothetical protein G5T42_05405 [Microbacterium sp. 4R-513]